MYNGVLFFNRKVDICLQSIISYSERPSSKTLKRLAISLNLLFKLYLHVSLVLDSLLRKIVSFKTIIRFRIRSCHDY